MNPPSCPITGKHIRWLLLAGVLGYLVYFLYDGITEPASARSVYLCDTGDDNEMLQCSSLDDVTTCSGYTDADGNAATCIESSCGYRLFHHIDVSIAGTSDPFDADAATSPTSFLSAMMIFWGLVPYIMGAVYLVLFLASGDMTPLTRLLVLGVISIMNDFIFKKLVKQHRPTGSCLYFLSYGMPSGHAATSIGLLTYLLLEIFLCHPDIICGLTCRRLDYGNAYTFEWGYGWHRQAEEEPSADANNGAPADSTVIDIKDDGAPVADNMNRGEPARANSDGSASSEPLLQSCNATTVHVLMRPFQQKWFHHWCALGYFVLLFPVPFSRVYLHDHLRSQVGYGALIGMVSSALWYLGCVRTCAMRIISKRSGPWGQWWGLKFGWREGFA